MKTLLFLIISINIMAQQADSLSGKNNYGKVTPYDELISIVESLNPGNLNIRLEYIAESTEGRKIPLLKISKTEFGLDKDKLKAFIFAQQHGNEQSGKEGALLILKKIAAGELNNLFDDIDLLLIPQANPDGSEKNQRRNSREMDLNRNHLILTEPEVIGIHKVFNTYMPEMALDVHEYYPFTEDWEKFGYVKHWDEQFGTTTNPNVAEDIREYSNEEFLPYVKEYLEEKGFSFNNYILGGPPGECRMRHSTFDINDGRQSFGILNSFSFILEGLNGKDAFAESIKHRAEGQAAAIEAFLRFGAENKNNIISLVKEQREKLASSAEGEDVTIRMEHVKGDKPLQLTLQSVYSGKDSVITVGEYHNEFSRILQVKKPAGYLLPKSDSRIKPFLDNHNIKYTGYNKEIEDKVFKYAVIAADAIELEETVIADPGIRKEIVNNINSLDYYFVPINQMHSNMLVLGLEPQSMLGVVVYPQYSDWVTPGKDYPVLRVERAKE
jgi:hypothetical protein